MEYIDKVKFYLFIVEGLGAVNGNYKKVKRKFNGVYYIFGQDDDGELWIQSCATKYYFELEFICYICSKENFLDVYGKDVFTGDLVESVVDIVLYNLNIN